MASIQTNNSTHHHHLKGFNSYHVSSNKLTVLPWYNLMYGAHLISKPNLYQCFKLFQPAQISGKKCINTSGRACFTRFYSNIIFITILHTYTNKYNSIMLARWTALEAKWISCYKESIRSPYGHWNNFVKYLNMYGRL